jgi:hypothetical protein
MRINLALVFSIGSILENNLHLGHIYGDYSPISYLITFPMEKNLPIHLQEIIFGSSDKKLSKQISKLGKDGQIRKIAPRIYTSNLTEGKDVIILRNLFVILGTLYPGSVLIFELIRSTM